MQFCPQSGASAKQITFYGADRAAGDLGNFLDRQFVQMEQRQDCTLQRRQAGHGGRYMLEQFGIREAFFQVGVGRDRIEWIGIVVGWLYG